MVSAVNIVQASVFQLVLAVYIVPGLLFVLAVYIVPGIVSSWFWLFTLCQGVFTLGKVVYIKPSSVYIGLSVRYNKFWRYTGNHPVGYVSQLIGWLVTLQSGSI